MVRRLLVILMILTFACNEEVQTDFDFASLGLTGKYDIRDVWRQKSLGKYEGNFKTSINHHGVVFLQFKMVKM